jgi:hypothetical protein
MLQAINPPQEDHIAGDMNKCPVDGERAVIAHDQSSEVAEPSDTAFSDLALLVASQRAPVLGRRPVAVRSVRGNQGDHPCGFLARTPAAVPPPDPDHGQRFSAIPTSAGEAARGWCERTL